MRGITCSVRPPAGPDGSSLAAFAQRAESLGVHSLRVSDHPGTSLSPFVLLAHAAAVTERLRLDTYVLNAGLREPVQLASDAATLDVLSAGRVTIGLGAGHTPAEWEIRGSARPGPTARIERLAQVADATARLLAGETVDDTALGLQQATLPHPRPVQQPVPLLIGGSNPRLVDLALDRAHVIGLSGLGRTLADGHRHETRWSEGDLDALARRLERRRPDQVVDALVQHVAVTDRRSDAAEQLADRLEGTSATDVLACPFVLVGTLDQIADEMVEHRQRFGITSWCIAAEVLDELAPLLTV